MKKINYRRILTTFSILVTSSIFSFGVIFGASESGNGEEFSKGAFQYIFVHLFTFLYYVIAFPDILMWKFDLSRDIYSFWGGILAGALFWTFFIELIFNRYRRKSKSEIENPKSDIKEI